MASRTNHQVERFLSWRPDPEAFAIDAFTLDWRDFHFWYFSHFQSIITSAAENTARPGHRPASVPILADSTLVSSGNAVADRPAAGPAKKTTSPSPARATRRFTRAPPTGIPAVDGLPLVGRFLADQRISGQTAAVITSAWRQSTIKQYRPYLRKWEEYCGRRSADPFNPPLHLALDYPTELLQTGIGYSAISTAKWAIASVTGTVNGRDFASHPLVKKFMKGVFQRKPSLPRYRVTWSVGQVLSYLEQQTLSDISLKDLTLKVTMLLCLLTGQRLQTLAAMHLDHTALNDHQCIFYINEVLKFSRPQKHIAPVTPRRYDVNTNLCGTPFTQVLGHDRSLIRRDKAEARRLLLRFRKPHCGVTVDTISLWVKQVLCKLGIDTTIFSAHSARGASTSAAARRGAPLDAILTAASWSSAKTFCQILWPGCRRSWQWLCRCCAKG